MTRSVSVEQEEERDHRMIIVSLFIAPFKKNSFKANVSFHYYVTLNNNTVLLKRDKQVELKIGAVITQCSIWALKNNARQYLFTFQPFNTSTPLDMKFVSFL